MRLSIFLSLILTCFFLLGISHPAHALDVQDVRFGAHPDKTRMVIELDQAPKFRAFMLPADKNKPYRLVIDLPEFNWRAGSIPQPRKTTVLDVRSGSLQSGITRLVVDLGKPAQLKKAFILPKSSNTPTRLVLDFKTISKTQFSSIERKTFGTLKVSTSNAAPQITKQTTNNFKTAVLSTRPKTKNGIILPSRKPSPPQKASPSTPPPVKNLYKPLIVIDAGHGGADSGASGKNRAREKNVTLSAAKELKRALEATGRYRAILTRSNDRYIKLYKRVSIARSNNADLFISLHADSISKSSVRGASIYTLSNKSSDAQTAKLAARENQVDLIAGVDLSHEDKDVANILIDLAMRDTMNQSKFFANTVVSKMRARGIRILEKPHRYAGFAVLKAPDIPSVLVEMGFMSNRQEVKLLVTKKYQRKIASALTDSIDSYFEKVRKNNVR